MKHNDELLEKPFFFKNVKDGIISILGFIFGIVPSFIPTLYKIKFFNIPLNWLLLFSSIIICLFIYIAIYFYRISKFYKKYTEQYERITSNRNSLLQDNEILKQKNKFYIRKLSNMTNIINSIETTLDSASKTPNGYEKELINSLLKNVLIHKKIIEKDDNNEY